MSKLTLICAFRFALRESRSAVKDFKIFIVSLFLGTTIVAGVGSVTSNISNSIRLDGQIFLGGDVEISQIQKALNKNERKHLNEWGQISEIATLRSMAHVKDDSSLVDLKAVDSAYPLYGELLLKSGEYSPDILAKKSGKFGVLLSPALATKLNLHLGSQIKLGTEFYEVRGIITKEPDVNNQGFQLAPGAIVALESLIDTSLVQPESLIRYYNRIKLNHNVSIILLRNNIKENFPDHTWRIRDSSSGGAGLRRFVGRMGQFMTLVGLTALLVGGVGVSNAVRSYLAEKTNTIATYKILGGCSRIILLTYLGQILLMATGAILLGLITGALLPIAAGEILKESLPVGFDGAIHPKPLILAAFYSYSVAMIFTLWPLGKATQVPAAQLFRQTVSMKQTVRQSLPYILIISTLLFLLIAVIIYMSEFRLLTAVTLAAAAAAFVVLLGAATLAKKIAKSVPRPRNPVFHIALNNIYRPGNSTNSIVMSLGLGLILFTSIALIEYNLLREIKDRVGGEAPSFFFLDIQKSQHDEFTHFLKTREGIQSYRTVPNLRGRVTHVNGIEARKLHVKPEGRWILRGDKGISFTHTLPADNIITAGAWWPRNYDGPSQISISKQMADSMGLGIGDKITVNILGRDFTLPISSVRAFNWESFGINYVMMIDPKTLISAPFNYVATAKAFPRDEPAIYQALTKKFPSISIVRMTDMLNNAIALLAKISGAIDVMAAVTIISGIVVLAGAIAAGHKSRIYDAAVLKVVGATRYDILKAYLIEFLFLGALAGFIAIILGSAAAYSVIKIVMGMSWQLPLTISVNTVLASITVTLVFGMVSIWRAMSARPAHILRGNHT